MTLYIYEIYLFSSLNINRPIVSLLIYNLTCSPKISLTKSSSSEIKNYVLNNVSSGKEIFRINFTFINNVYNMNYIFNKYI